jgi:hypothetical protein
MSEENVEIVRRFFRAIARGEQDETPLDTMQRLALVSNPSAREERGRLPLRSPARRRRQSRRTGAPGGYRWYPQPVLAESPQRQGAAGQAGDPGGDCEPVEVLAGAPSCEGSTTRGAEITRGR